MTDVGNSQILRYTSLQVHVYQLKGHGKYLPETLVTQVRVAELKLLKSVNELEHAES
jgi:hypothetical protein